MSRNPRGPRFYKAIASRLWEAERLYDLIESNVLGEIPDEAFLKAYKELRDQCREEQVEEEEGPETPDDPLARWGWPEKEAV